MLRIQSVPAELWCSVFPAIAMLSSMPVISVFIEHRHAPRSTDAAGLERRPAAHRPAAVYLVQGAGGNTPGADKTIWRARTALLQQLRDCRPLAGIAFNPPFLWTCRSYLDLRGPRIRRRR